MEPNNTDYLKKLGCSTIATFTATSLVHPFDVLRIMHQVNKTPEMTFSGLYRGYSVGLLRQCTYSIPNVFMYSELQNTYREKYGSDPTFAIKCGFGITSGSIGGFTGTPSELMMIRSINPNTLTPGIFPSFKAIWSQYGIRGFFRGYSYTIARSAVFNGARLSVYSETKKEILQQYPTLEGTTTSHIVSALSGACAGVFISNPLDVVKTRIQMYPGSNPSTIVRNIASEGPLAFYKGVFPSLTKSIPHSVISFVVLEQLTRIWMGKEVI